MEESYIQKIIAEVEEMTPKTGFNIVIFDDFAEVGERLTRVGHAETREEAEKIAKEYHTEQEPAFIYEGENVD